MDSAVIKAGPVEAGETSIIVDSAAIVRGRVVAVHMTPVYSCESDAPQVVVETVGGVVLMTFAAGAPETWKYPTVQQQAPETGNNVAGEFLKGIPIFDKVRVTLTDAEPGDYAEVELLLE